MTVERDDLERHLDTLRREVRDSRAGIYGPGSTSWNIGKEGILFLGGGRAALLQLAHPFVAHAVDQHSKTKTDLIGRFQRTFTNVFAMVFGDLDHAFKSARRVHAIHLTVSGQITEDVGAFHRGTRYEANTEEALLWVHATLVETALLVYDRCVRRLDDAERDRYWRESKRFARLFGIPDRILPDGWVDFDAYCRQMYASDVLSVGRPARELGEFLFKAPTRAHEPLLRWYRTMTAGLLPERLRDGFGLPFGAVDRAVFRASLVAIRPVVHALPRRIRYVPAYVEAHRRIAGKGPDRVGRLLERIALRGIDPRSKAERRATERAVRASG
jgi:uncharacterized protein (DUF2236 family)